MNIPCKYVLTGAPCTGKTTLLNFFASKGYQSVQEASTIIMKEEKEKGNPRPWDDLVYFQTRLLNKQLDLESKLDLLPCAFVDRGIVDGIAYCKLFKSSPPPILIEKIKQNRYAGIFLLDFLPFYAINSVRFESYKVARKIQMLLKEAYESAGYQVIDVPVFEIGIRAEFVLSKIDYFSFQPQAIKTLIHEDAK
jgi:predicted ATPase